MRKYQAPAVREHTDFCRAYIFRWRFTVPAAEAADHTIWPCQCPQTRAWRLVETPHPAWCAVAGVHAWTECTVPGTGQPKE